MKSIILNGQFISDTLRKQLHQQIATLPIQPKLVVILVGQNPASEIYVRNKQKACLSVGIDCEIQKFPEDISESQMIECIKSLNQSPETNGILIQLPLPKHINVNHIIEWIDPKKDVDGFHPMNMGLLSLGTPKLRACTPYGIMQLMKAYQIDLTGKDVLVIGASRIVGLPMALELLNHKATVTICHSKSKDLQEKIIQNEILIVAAGQRQLIQPSSFRAKHIIIDVGIHRLPNQTIVGDVDFEEASKVVQAISPVPGGVGPMTITALIQNVFLATQYQLED